MYQRIGYNCDCIVLAVEAREKTLGSGNSGFCVLASRSKANYEVSESEN